MSASRRGMIIIISAPSGAGKTSIAKSLVATDDKLTLSISCTTRSPRPREVEGVDYNFITEEEFNQLLQINDEVLEYTNVFGHFYCTSKSRVEAALDSGLDIILVLDCNGAKQINTDAIKCRKVVKIFILPPSISHLRNRLIARDSDSLEEIKLRLEQAESEMLQSKYYDHVVVNDSLDVSVDKVAKIIEAERCKEC